QGIDKIRRHAGQDDGAVADGPGLGAVAQVGMLLAHRNRHGEGAPARCGGASAVFPAFDGVFAVHEIAGPPPATDAYVRQLPVVDFPHRETDFRHYRQSSGTRSPSLGSKSKPQVLGETRKLTRRVLPSAMATAMLAREKPWGNLQSASRR